MPITAGIYARISQDREDEGLGVIRQLEDCRTLAAKNGWTVIDEYVDNDVSATATKPRPQYERLMSDLRSGRITAALVWDIDRLTRKPRELEDFIDLVEANKVSLANVSGEVDLSTESGRLFARIKGAVARAEAEKMGKRLARQKQQRAEQGMPPAGGRYRTYGYTREWQVVPEEAEHIRDAYRRAILGESLQAIADHWTSVGVNMGGGKAVYFSTVNNVLKRQLYAGVTVHNGQIMGKSQVPAIIDEATFNAAQLALGGRSNTGPRGKNARVYLLSGIISCGECLFPLGGGPTAKDKHGKTRHRYACRKAIGGCGKVTISGTAVESLVLAVVRQNLIVRKHPNRATKVNYTPQIDKVGSDIKSIQQSVREKKIEPMDAVPLIRDLSDERRFLQRAEAEQVTEDRDGFADWDEFRYASISEQKALTNRAVKAVFVYTASGSTRFDPSRVVMHMAKSGNIVPGDSRGLWDKAQSINPLIIVDGFRQKHSVLHNRT